MVFYMNMIHFILLGIAFDELEKEKPRKKKVEEEFRNTKTTNKSKGISRRKGMKFSDVNL